MFTANINDSKIRQDELLRQAAGYRLVRSLPKTGTPALSLSMIIRGLIAGLSLR